MATQRKLSRPTDQRKALLRGQVTSLLQHGRITTTVTRAKEIKKIAEKVISDAVNEVDNFTSTSKKVSSAKVDPKGQKVLTTKKSKNDNEYKVVEREITENLKTVDSPARLHARRKAIQVLYRVKDEKGENLNIANKLFDEIAIKYKDRKGGYTRMYKIGPRRGDAAEMVVLELV
jgi:large subunit ribosomal protein L17